MDPAPVRLCPECPWRVHNMDRPVPEKYAIAYSRDERVEMWSALRAGESQQSCHMTTSDRELFPEGADPVWTEAGFRPVPEHARPRECAGAVAMADRELRRLQAAGSWERYHERYPQGLTREVAAEASRLERRRVQVDVAELVDMTGGERLSAGELLSPEQVSALLGALAKVGGILAPDCHCPVCALHGNVHAQTRRVIFGRPVNVDQEIAPLLDALAASGVLTVGSCVDLAGATERLWPARLPELLADRDRPGVNYGRIVAEQLAFVRMIDEGRAADFLEAVDARGGIVTRSRPLAQVAFPRHMLPELVELAGS